TPLGRTVIDKGFPADWSAMAPASSHFAIRVRSMAAVSSRGLSTLSGGAAVALAGHVLLERWLEFAVVTELSAPLTFGAAVGGRGEREGGWLVQAPGRRQYRSSSWWRRAVRTEGPSRRP